MLVRLVGIVVILLVLNNYAGAYMYCLSCNDVIHPTECDTIAKCGVHEVCFLDTFVTLSGYIRFNVGCRDRSHCPSAPSGLGKRNIPSETVQDAIVYSTRHERGQENLTVAINTSTLSEQRPLMDSVTYEISMKRSSDLLTCTECCEGDLCANAGCGTSGYPTTRGPICFNCDQQTTQDDCSKIKVCGQGQVCMLEKSISQMTHNALYSTRCASPKTCNDEMVKLKDLTSLLIGKRMSDTFQIEGSCIAKCCSDDLCNNYCGVSHSSKATVPPNLVTHNPAQTLQPCTDKLPNCATYDKKTSCEGVLEQWGIDNCRKYCNKCTATGNYGTTITVQLPNTTTVPPNLVTHNPAQTLQPCTDKLPNCATYDKKTSCEGVLEQWGIDNCRKYCNKCTATGNYGTTITVQLHNTTGFCVHKSKMYNQGDVWQDGCQYNCTCEDAKTGFYRCKDICPVYNLPAGCTLEKKPGECCSHPNCRGQIHTPGGTANTCFYGNKYYHEGDTWKDGCKYKCTCQDGKTSFYQCEGLCLQWSLPQSCHLDPPPAGKCCHVPVCPSNVVFQYPQGYVQE